MENITSKDNEKIKRLRKLSSPKYRQEFKQFCVENAVIIRDARLSGKDFQQLFVTQQLIDKKNELYSEIIDYDDSKVFIIDEKINKSFSNLDSPSGICAVYGLLENNFTISDNIIYLNNISDPGNLGTILRSALAFGFKNIVLDSKCVDLYNHKVIQAAKDSIFKLDISIDNDRGIIKKIKKHMDIYCTSLKGNGNVIDLKEKEIYCLVFGNESHGIDKDILELSNKLIKINMTADIESLNVASSAAIIFYELFKD